MRKPFTPKLTSEMIVDRKPLVADAPKKEQQLYLLLLSNQVTIIDTELEVMRKFKKEYPNNYVIEMMETDARLISQTSMLENLIENLNNYNYDSKKENSAKEKASNQITIEGGCGSEEVGRALGSIRETFKPFGSESGDAVRQRTKIVYHNSRIEHGDQR